jgi:hypothetical protein
MSHSQVAWNRKNGHAGHFGDSLLEELQLLANYLWGHGAQPGEIAARAGKARNQSSPHWIATGRHDDRNRAGRLLDGSGRLLPLRYDYVNFELDQLGG